ncbi:MAG: hypothetical protein ACYC8T_31545 [Myxococcaceae bacterium]
MVMLERDPELLGSRNRTMVLEAVRLLEETYPSELAKVLGLRLFSVQSILAAFEREGVIVSRHLGRTRRVSLNPRYFAHQELEALLWKLGKQDVALQSMLATRRRRPRRPGKPGLP